MFVAALTQRIAPFAGATLLGTAPAARAPALGADRIDRAHQHDEDGVVLATTARAAAAIRAGRHQVRCVDGVALRYPSQDLRLVESVRPNQHGQTHGLTKHLGHNLADNVRRLHDEPAIRAAGSYVDLAAAQRATDRTIAAPVNQRAIGAFLADPHCEEFALTRIDLGTVVGTTTLRTDLDAGRPALIPCHTATVVLIKDPSFPENYRVLTTYPDTRPAEVAAERKQFAA
jgi:hypothetical protein